MRIPFAFTLSLILLSLLFPACRGGEDEGGGRGGSRAFPVEVETVTGRDVEYVVSAVGSVEAFEEVLVTARVSGVIEKINFREGQTVDEETVLVEIEPKRFQYELDVAEAAHERAVAELKEAKDGLRRREEPKGEGSAGIFSKEEIEAWRTKVAVASANEKLRAAELNQAELNLENARPTPPMSGEVQQRLVKTGQWGTEGTVIASLLQRDPMLVRFSVPEDEATAVRTGQTATFAVGAESKRYTSEIVHVAASADPTTRMVDVTAEVTSPEAAALTPGSFARVKVVVGAHRNAATVPETAVRPSEQGYLVYVVEDGKAQRHVIEIGLRTPDGRIEVKKGLEVGDVVVIRGADALRPGAEVAIAGDSGGENPKGSP